MLVAKIGFVTQKLWDPVLVMSSLSICSLRLLRICDANPGGGGGGIGRFVNAVPIFIKQDTYLLNFLAGSPSLW